MYEEILDEAAEEQFDYEPDDIDNYDFGINSFDPDDYYDFD